MGPNPTIPSTPLKPVALDAPSMDCEVTSAEPMVTVSVYSVPENEPDPYETETDLPVDFPVIPY